jgi:hypothetical protein
LRLVGWSVLAALAVPACGPSAGNRGIFTDKAAGCRAVANLDSFKNSYTGAAIDRFTKAQLAQFFETQKNLQVPIANALRGPIQLTYERQAVAEWALEDMTVDAVGNQGWAALHQKAAAAGFQSDTDYVARDGIRLADGTTTTYAQLKMQETQTSSLITATCHAYRFS